jgi:hypothetical protein
LTAPARSRIVSYVRPSARFAAVAAAFAFSGAAACFVELDAPSPVDAGAVTDAPGVDGGDAGCRGGDGFLRVQATGANTLVGTSDNLSVKLLEAQVAGDFLAVGVNHVECGGVKRIADSVGNGYERFVAADTMGDAGTLETWGAKNIVAAGAAANTVTVTFGATCQRMNVKVVEYRGVDPTAPVDTSTSAHGTGGAPAATLTVASPELLFAHTADGLVAQAAGDGWTLIFEDEWKTIAQERIARSAGAYPVSFRPSTGESWVIQALALRCR